MFCHWWLRWRLNSLFLYFLSCRWKLNSFYFVIILFFLLIYFLFLALNSPPRLAGAFFFHSWMNQTSVLFLPHRSRGFLVRFGRSVTWAEEVDSIPWDLPLVWLVYGMNTGRQRRAEEKKALCSALFSIHGCSLQILLWGWEVGAVTSLAEVQVWKPTLRIYCLFSGCSTGCYSIFSSAPSCLYINRKKKLFCFVLFTFVQKKRKKKRKWNQIRIGCFVLWWFQEERLKRSLSSPALTTLWLLPAVQCSLYTFSSFPLPVYILTLLEGYCLITTPKLNLKVCLFLWKPTNVGCKKDHILQIS